MRIRRLISALSGGLLLVSTIFELGRGTFGFYQEHYLMPMEKYGVLTALRWQDDVFLAGLWIVAAGLLYLSYKLLRYGAWNR